MGYVLLKFAGVVMYSLLVGFSAFVGAVEERNWGWWLLAILLSGAVVSAIYLIIVI